jgi:hypothetical protein
VPAFARVWQWEREKPEAMRQQANVRGSSPATADVLIAPTTDK